MHLFCDDRCCCAGIEIPDTEVEAVPSQSGSLLARLLFSLNFNSCAIFVDNNFPGVGTGCVISAFVQVCPLSMVLAQELTLGIKGSIPQQLRERQPLLVSLSGTHGCAATSSGHVVRGSTTMLVESCDCWCHTNVLLPNKHTSACMLQLYASIGMTV